MNFDVVDTLFYGPNRVTWPENKVRGRYHSISYIDERIDRVESP